MYDIINLLFFLLPLFIGVFPLFKDIYKKEFHDLVVIKKLTPSGYTVLACCLCWIGLYFWKSSLDDAKNSEDVVGSENRLTHKFDSILTVNNLKIESSGKIVHIDTVFAPAKKDIVPMGTGSLSKKDNLYPVEINRNSPLLDVTTPPYLSPSRSYINGIVLNHYDFYVGNIGIEPAIDVSYKLVIFKLANDRLLIDSIVDKPNPSPNKFANNTPFFYSVDVARSITLVNPDFYLFLKFNYSDITNKKEAPLTKIYSLSTGPELPHELFGKEFDRFKNYLVQKRLW